MPAAARMAASVQNDMPVGSASSPAFASALPDRDGQRMRRRRVDTPAGTPSLSRRFELADRRP